LGTELEKSQQQGDAQCDPDLGKNGVLGGAEEAFELQILFDPFEE
jgi:hypothetical protein